MAQSSLSCQVSTLRGVKPLRWHQGARVTLNTSHCRAGRISVARRASGGRRRRLQLYLRDPQGDQRQDGGRHGVRQKCRLPFVISLILHHAKGNTTTVRRDAALAALRQ